MAETEVLEWLANKRLSGDDRFFTIKDIERGLDDEKRNHGWTGKQVKRLYWFGFVEIFHETMGPFKPFKFWYRASTKGLNAVNAWGKVKGKDGDRLG